MGQWDGIFEGRGILENLWLEQVNTQFQLFLNNCSCRYASNGEKCGGKGEEAPNCQSYGFLPTVPLVSSFLSLRPPTLKQSPSRELTDAWPSHVKAFSSNSFKELLVSV